MGKKGAIAMGRTALLIIGVFVVLVVAYSLRTIPEEIERQGTCEARIATSCYEGDTCPRGTDEVPDLECPNGESCCIGIVEELEIEMGEAIIDEPDVSGEDDEPSRPQTTPAQRRAIEDVQERLSAARRDRSIERISEEHNVAMGMIILRFRQYEPPTSVPMTPENTPFDYNTVKSFEQMTIAAEAAFRFASDEKKQWAGSQGYFNTLCRDWTILIRAHLEGYYEESTYGLDNWLQNTERVFRDYEEYIGDNNRACDAMRSVTRSTSFSECKTFWIELSEDEKRAVLAEETPTEEGWDACLPFANILRSQIINFKEDSFDQDRLFYRRTLQEIFQEEET